jgi:hypothetical protein
MVLVLFMGVAMLLSPAQGVVRQEVRWGMMCGLSKPNSGITLWEYAIPPRKTLETGIFCILRPVSLAI